ncbi:MAG TPA: alpha-glucuronidase family glycosyl hydrolase [Gemmatimonadaceae bacterium]|nr:alpha-glucuronidase family glycosyl hydrolase [Gemmatimonadaceae bacterium]
MLRAEDGYDLWLRYQPVADTARLREYRTAITEIVIADGSPTMAAARDELVRGFRGLLGADVPVVRQPTRSGALVVGTPASSRVVASLGLAAALKQVGDEGYLIRSATVGGKRVTVIAANRDAGALYGAFALLRRMQTSQSLRALNVASAPKIRLRMLDHWDNLDRSVERGYAGRSLWEWEALPDSLSPRYRDYARANASLGINGTVLTNVNANARVLTPEYLKKVAALAGVFRPYGIKVYLTARFSAPLEIGGLKTADPLDPAVRAWWKQKVDEIYTYVPDFGGLLVKANSEGQPGPQDYKRTHADGANVLADALAPHGGIVMWRAFVYSAESPTDRVKQAYDEFQPLDGRFRENVFVQVKSGPLDFQPREPFHPLFGAMPKTPLMMELQVTKEYLGQDTHLVYLGAYFEEVLRADTYAKGKGSTVARVIDGSLRACTEPIRSAQGKLRECARTGIAGVSNIGDDRNWTGSQFNQANWYAYGRLAWDPALPSSGIAEEWVRQTFSNDPEVVSAVRGMMMTSREVVVNYMTPLGLTHIMATGHHYGPGPWVANLARPEWNPAYYHRADTLGVGFDRTARGSNAVAQYFPPVRDRYASRATVPDSLLLWFHRVGWGERMRSGRTLWDELAYRYNAGVDSVRAMQRTWNALEGRVDAERFAQVRDFLAIQEREARWWRDAALSYFATFSRMPVPAQYEQPAHSLDYYLKLRCPSDVTRPRCEGVP